MATFNSSIRESVRDYNIICAICQDEFNDPVMIDCHHSFCRTCIEPWVDRTSNRQRSQEGFSYHGPTREFKCPTCKSVNKLPRQGIAGFPKSFYIEQLKEAEAKFQSLYQAKSQSPYPICVKHKTEDLRFYCTKCETLICRDCKVLKHEGHTAECVSDVANNMRAKLKEIINTADEDLEKLYQASTICTHDKKGVIKMKKSARNKVKNQAEEMKRTIDNVVGVLDQNICTYFQTYEDEIDKETLEVDTKSDELHDFKDIVLQEIEDGSDHDIISNYKGFLENRGLIVVAGNQHPNPDYKSKLANVYCEGSINVAQLKNMVGTVAGKAIELPKSISEEEEVEMLNVFSEFELEDDLFSDWLGATETYSLTVG